MKTLQIKLLFFAILLFISVPLTFSGETKAPKWKVEFDDDINYYTFVDDESKNTYLFFANEENMWLYNSKSGDEIWKGEIKDYEKKGLHMMLGKRYLVSSEDNLLCYDVLTGKQIWSVKYDKVDQADYQEIYSLDDIAVIRYDDWRLGVDLTSGKELWRIKYTANQDLLQAGGYTRFEFEKQGKVFLLLDDDEAMIYDIHTGKEVWHGKDFEINNDLVKNGFEWEYTTDDENIYYSFLKKAQW